ncbi:Rid family hydrolase [Actinorugispora endophytica]|uniref:Enamine deaminase RidA (YjgF/YER057c/UK114 family) n=1 Tax=Actinorugispora endophytica TaxID=1605990 RepID=A0A4R6V7A6_9ACTN|nr:Rid family hydrolase [Actinorugispora endophytica]TDQ54986.1 enamine deaminase RidA (YjgF/YER057c/UK114 family) [Actinorugispora endophytica]
MVSKNTVESFGVPWEQSYGYVQAVKHGDTIYLSGQVAHEGTELVAPAPVGPDGRVTDFTNTAAQMRQCYANAARLLKRFGASLDDVVDEVIYVVDADAGDAAAGPVRKEAYGRPDPQVASTMIGTPRLAFPELLVEVRLLARM